MKRFEVIVTREDKYIIEIDSNVHDEEWMDDFRQYFYNIHTLQEHAEHIAQIRSRFGERFIEGYGNVLTNGNKPFGKKSDEVNSAINIKVISEDEDIWIDSKEL